MQITIIGSGPGVSNATAQLFGSKGFKVALIARKEEKLKAEIAALQSTGIESMYAVGDAGNEQSLNDALTKITAVYGDANMILYNAFAAVYKPIANETWESLQQQFSVNVGGAFHLLKRVLPHYKKENKGKLFFTGGGLSMYPQPKFPGLGMGKAALRNLVTGTAAGVQGTNIHIATVTICGFVTDKDPKYNSSAIAEQYWKLYNQKEGEFETEIIY